MRPFPTMNPALLSRISQARANAPATRRAILEAIPEDPDRVLAESF